MKRKISSICCAVLLIVALINITNMTTVLPQVGAGMAAAISRETARGMSTSETQGQDISATVSEETERNNLHDSGEVTMTEQVRLDAEDRTLIEADARFDGEREGRIIKVGWPIQGKLTSVEKDGQYSGYNYEYLMRIEQYTGWKFEFVEPNPPPKTNALEWLYGELRKGEIHLIGSMRYSESSADDNGYKHSAESYCASYTTLITPVSNHNLFSVADLAQTKVKIAVYENAINFNKLLTDYCESLSLDYEFISFKTEQEQFEAINSGVADMMPMTDFMVPNGYRIVAKYNYNPLYFIASPTDQDVLRGLNAALTEIEHMTPQFKLDLYQKYFGTKEETLLLTDAETAYVKSSPPFPVMLNPNSAPFQYRDDAGNLVGITVDLLKLIEKRTGLTFEYRAVAPDDYSEELLRGGNIVTGSIAYNYELAKKSNLSMTSPYLTVPTLMVANMRAKDKDFSSATVGIVRGSQVDELLHFHEIRVFEDIESLMDATERGEVDFAYANSYSVSYYGFQPKYKNLISVPVISKSKEFCIAVAKDADRVLYTILNKALRAISASEISAIVSSNSGNQRPDLSFRAFISAHPIETIVVGLVGFFIVIGIFVLFFLLKLKSNRRLVLDAKRYTKLSELSGEYMVEYQYDTDRMTMTPKCAELFGIPKTVSNYSQQAQFNEFKLKVSELATERELLLPLANGRKHWFRIVSATVKDGEKLVSVLSKLTDIQHEKEERHALYEKSVKDDLTALHKIGYFRDSVSVMLASDKVRTGAFLIFDFDDFKGINDRFGHSEGDRMLVALADIMRECFGEDSVVARLGGDEFVAYISDIEAAPPAVTAQCVLNNMKQVPLGDRVVTVSCGICTTHGGEDYEDVYRTADKALYRVKEKGGNGIESIDSSVI